MLDLINEARTEAGVEPVVMGSNRAAQVHAEKAIEGCFSGHWGLDGTKPYMRYSLAGGYQFNGENVAGHYVCIRPGQGYASLGSIDRAVKRMMHGFMGSPGHRENILYPTHRKVNLGIVWDRYNIRLVQHFEGDYLEFERLPEFSNGQLKLLGTLRNGATLRTSSRKTDLGVQIFYDPPLQALTRGQLIRAYSYGHGDLVAAVRPPAGDGYEYTSDSFTQCGEVSRDPYNISPDADAPDTPEDSALLHGLAKTLPLFTDCATLPWLRRFTVDYATRQFRRAHGHGAGVGRPRPRIYTVILWAEVGGEAAAVAEFPIFHETEPPDLYYP